METWPPSWVRIRKRLVASRKTGQCSDEMQVPPWTGPWHWEIYYKGFWLINHILKETAFRIEDHNSVTFPDLHKYISFSEKISLVLDIRLTCLRLSGIPTTT